ncbi:FAD dependent oxidoreductase [Nannochloropsis gaditana]|uniref:FAD dependent oxidoreductase n=1 Tax=Nannochloropsis gaditana TaxID=72520 RepID=W7U3N6_9STRA|nr:FAD dependent oxidoreductase [Nannochloropsis gaditana]
MSGFVSTLALRRPQRLLPVALSLIAFLDTFRPINTFATSYHMMAASSPAAPAAYSGNENIVVVGGGIMGACTLYYLTQKGLKPVLIERSEIAAAASGKAGGFLARSWHTGATAELYGLSFDMHAQLAKELGIESYRQIPTLQVQGGPRAGQKKSKVKPSWLNGRADSAFMDDDTAQVTPKEFTEKIVAAAVANGAQVVKGTVVGLAFGEGQDGTAPVASIRTVTGVQLEGQEEEPIPCSKVVVATGPWAPVAGEWFGIPVPMEGIYSTSIVLPNCEAASIQEPYALFCGEDENGCHIEVYPRPDGKIYMCGLGGSDYVGGSRLTPGGDCDRPEKILPKPHRVHAAMKSFSAMSPSMAHGKEPMAAACMRPCSQDGLPILGKIPTATNAYLATALNQWGILGAPAAGLCMAELVAEGKAKSANIDAFSPARFFTSRTRRGKKMKGIEVGEQW